MTVHYSDVDIRRVLLGTLVSKATGTLTNSTSTLFNVTGGKCMITSIVGEVTTSVTVANTYKLQANPTTGVTGDLVTATDIGSTDSPAGNLMSFGGFPSDSILTRPGVAVGLRNNIVVNTGTIEQVSSGTDGAITWTLTYVALDDGATITAA